ncbi:MEDS domain-containing protein [Actinoplanes sp. NPDC024001]|uniref:MEDS domain-containing protein n=1 Tax=Actinoplanes sp. NPDC024001 TaxID=3154598 RepID=UPI0033DC250F
MAHGASSPEHTCWAYDDHQTFVLHARAFLHAGLTAGEQVWYVPGRRSSGVTGWLLDGAPDWPPGAVRVFDPQEVYSAAGAFDPVAQLTAYMAATQDAVAAGFRGLRVVADATAMVRTRPQLDAFVRYEYAIGRYMRTAPLSALCVYDRTELGDRAVAELACVHRRTNAGHVPFQMYPGRTARDTVLTGEVDGSAEDLFATVLERAELHPVAGEVVVHAEELGFITHRGLLALQRHAERRELTVVIRTPLRTVAPMVGALGLTGIRVESLG